MDEKIESFARSILEQCASKGYSMNEVYLLCRRLNDLFQDARREQVSKLKLEMPHLESNLKTNAEIAGSDSGLL